MMPPPVDAIRQQRRNTILAVILGVVVITGVFTLWAFQIITEENRLTFDYSAVLEPNQSGEVRVSLPIPVNERLLESLRVVPTPSTLTFNRSGAEPALDLVITGRTFVNATFQGTQYATPAVMANLTRTGDILACGPNCSAVLAVEVLRGDVDQVRVALVVRWDTSCDFISWRLEASVMRGSREYPGQWARAVC